MSLLFRQCERQRMVGRLIFQSIFGSGRYWAPSLSGRKSVGVPQFHGLLSSLRWPESERALSCGSGCVVAWPPKDAALGHYWPLLQSLPGLCSCSLTVRAPRPVGLSSLGLHSAPAPAATFPLALTLPVRAGAKLLPLTWTTF